ncbi:MAG TPA: hypothetical protein V6C57_19765 [Coleofasciculaceae cyanobacterium]
MTGDQPPEHLPTRPPLQFAQSPRFIRNIPKAQESIYQFLLEIVKTWPPEEVLIEFKGLFIDHADTLSFGALPHLFEIIFSNQESEFRNTLKRSCYILINNWDITRNYRAIHQLTELFSDAILHKPTVSPTLKRLRGWLRRFVASRDFQELKLVASKYENAEALHWTERYTSYLLVPQYTNLDNSVEQRQVARNLSKKLKEKFKFELAMYTAFSHSKCPAARSPKNPTSLGDEVLYLIKRIVARRGIFSYPNLASIFLNQIRGAPYFQFKNSLVEYLVFSMANQEFVELLRKHLTEKLQDLHTDQNGRIVDDLLLLRTANHIVECLTVGDCNEPSPLFVQLLSRGNSAALVIVLLKLILICSYARTHLEGKIANLIRYYEKYSETDCQWVINFFEMFNVTMTIFTENVEYNIVTMNDTASTHSTSHSTSLGLEAYRIFSQARYPKRTSSQNALINGTFLNKREAG